MIFLQRVGSTSTGQINAGKIFLQSYFTGNQTNSLVSVSLLIHDSILFHTVL
jgi:hypothetical protein